MAFSLYDATVANYLQTLGAVTHFLDKSLHHFKEKGVDLNEIVETRLFPDMLPFRFQVISVVHHSRGALEGVKKGVFSPPTMHGQDYAALQAMGKEATEAVAKETPESINALEGRHMEFHIADRKVPYTAENFLLSFSMPNFYFHSTTTYDILRMKGVPLGKRDFMGKMRIKTA